jgi:putative Holliday junction resolvase
MPATPEARAADPAGSVLGFDFGKRFIGVAVGNRISGARPLTTVGHGDTQPDWQRIDTLVREWLPSQLIVGLPLQLDGSEQTMARAARDFAAALEQRYRLPVALVDERLTSVEASRRFAEQRARGTARRKDASTLDAIAAQIIIENWFAQGSAGA